MAFNNSTQLETYTKRGRSYVFILPWWFVLTIAVVLAGCSTQPTWKGRSLSAWLTELNDIDQKRSKDAEMAIKQIGTNAIPQLEKVLQAVPPSFGESLGEKQSEAVLAFRILGNVAAQSLPTLGFLLTNRVDIDPYPVAQSMAGIGEQAKPWLISALAHPSFNVRRAGLVGLIDLSKEARDAIPAVLERLKDTDAEVRGLALFFVNEVSDVREIKLRVFKEASQDSDRQIRSFAEKELGKLGE
jgi:hypothetical protein